MDIFLLGIPNGEVWEDNRICRAVSSQLKIYCIESLTCHGDTSGVLSRLLISLSSFLSPPSSQISAPQPRSSSLSRTVPEKTATIRVYLRSWLRHRYNKLLQSSFRLIFSKKKLIYICITAINNFLQNAQIKSGIKYSKWERKKEFYIIIILIFIVLVRVTLSQTLSRCLQTT